MGRFRTLCERECPGVRVGMMVPDGKDVSTELRVSREAVELVTTPARQACADRASGGRQSDRRGLPGNTPGMQGQRLNLDYHRWL